MAGKLVTVGSFQSAAEAHAAKHRLEADGIAAVVTDEAVGNWLGYMGTAIGGIKVQVAEAEAERSLEILYSKLSEGSASPPWRCRKCQEVVEGDFEVCWSCGGEREEVEDPTFEPSDAAEEQAVEAAVAADDVPNIEPPSEDVAMVDGRPNPYYAGNLPASATTVQHAPERAFDEDVEAMVTRAWRAAIIGVFLCPTLLLLNFYSAWLLLQVSLSADALSPSAELKYRLAWFVNFLAVFLMVVLLTMMFGVWSP
jgi:hypothetical protein